MNTEKRHGPTVPKSKPDPVLTCDRADLLDALRPATAAVKAAAIKHRCRADVLLFCAAYLGDRFTDAFSTMHRVFLDREKTPWRQRERVQRIADAAPRENAKSTIESWASVVHDIVYELEAYICIISTTLDLSEDLVADLYEVFTDAEVYPGIHTTFGPFKVTGTKTDFVVRRPGKLRETGCRVKAYSFGGSIRGTKHKGVRPTKVIIDDGEHPDRVRSPAVREKTWQFLTKDVLKVGARYTIYRVVGTVLHPDSMLERLLTSSPGWIARRWKAIEQWPERSDLWDRCRRLWADLTDPDRQDTARRFYERNRAAMDAGAVVLWPAREPLYLLMVQRWSDGEAAFSFEKQNEPLDPNRQVFFPDRWHRCTSAGGVVVFADGRRVDVNDCDVAVWLDPRSSREIERNDYAACAVVAREKDTGLIAVLGCLIGRVNTAQQLDWLWSMFSIYPYARYGYEDNGFAVLIGELLDQQRADRRAAGLSDQMPLIGYTSTANKMDRIMSLQPRLDLGWIEPAAGLPSVVVEQFRQIPTGAHDDGPDAIERAIWLLDGPGEASADLGVGW